jgi:hypothetical protein
MATTTVQDFVDAIATKASIDPVTAETAVGTILSAIQQEGVCDEGRSIVR